MRDTDYPIVWTQKQTGRQRKTLRRNRLQAMSLCRTLHDAGHTDVRWKGITWKRWYDYQGKMVK